MSTDEQTGGGGHPMITVDHSITGEWGDVMH